MIIYDHFWLHKYLTLVEAFNFLSFYALFAKSSMDWFIIPFFQSGELGAEALVVTRDDCVYGLGTNKNGCLGIGVLGNTLKPQKIEPLCGKGVIKFAYGGSNGPHVLALTKSGEVELCNLTTNAWNNHTSQFLWCLIILKTNIFKNGYWHNAFKKNIYLCSECSYTSFINQCIFISH